jgi:predicted nuclease of predicted toxin-antitoxin system
VNILIDVNLSPEWEHVLRSDHLAVHWSKIGPLNAPDEVIFQWAKSEGYVVLTNDLDFGAILAATKLDSPSVFQIRSLILDPKVIGSSVLECFKIFEKDLQKGALISYRVETSRAKKLPFK